MSIKVSTMPTTRSDSSTQSAKASRLASSPAEEASACSAPARRRVSGVRRSWATVSRAPRMPAINVSIRESMPLNRRASSSNSSPLRPTGDALADGAAFLDPLLDRGDQVAHRAHGAARQVIAAQEAGDDHQDHGAQDDPPQAAEQLAPVVVGLADLKQEPVGKPQGHDLQASPAEPPYARSKVSHCSADGAPRSDRGP